MIIKLRVDVLQVVQRGPPVFIWGLNWLEFLGVHEGYGCLKSWLLHSEKQALVIQVPKRWRYFCKRLVCLWDFLQTKNIWLDNGSKKCWCHWIFHMVLPWSWLRQILDVRLLKMVPSGIISQHLSCYGVWKHPFFYPGVATSTYRDQCSCILRNTFFFSN